MLIQLKLKTRVEQVGNFHFELMLRRCERIDIYFPPYVKYDSFTNFYHFSPPLTFSGKSVRALCKKMYTNYYKECKKETGAEAADNCCSYKIFHVRWVNSTVKILTDSS